MIVSVSEASPNDSREAQALSWQKHLGLILGAATSVLICLKLLAVAKWDPTTAFGILSASGTANVLVGTLLAVLPMLYGYMFVFVMPHVERKLKKRTPIERSAARVLEIWPAVLLVVILPAYLLLITLGTFVLVIVIRVWTRVASKRRKPQKIRAAEEPPSRFETTSAALGCLVMLSYASLATPWLPAEVVEVKTEQQAAYVLNRNSETAVVLLADSRKLQQVKTRALTGDYCQKGSRWISAPLPALWGDPRYPSCPG